MTAADVLRDARELYETNPVPESQGYANSDGGQWTIFIAIEHAAGENWRQANEARRTLIRLLEHDHRTPAEWSETAPVGEVLGLVDHAIAVLVAEFG